jgi:hypothetical protein
VQALIDKTCVDKVQNKASKKKSPEKAQESSLQKIAEENQSPSKRFSIDDNDSPLKRPISV